MARGNVIYHLFKIQDGLVLKASILLSLLVIMAPMAGYTGDFGNISGTVVNRETGEPIIGATIMIEGTQMGTSSDLDGHFLIKNVPIGDYSLKISGVGYEIMVIEDVQVKTSESTSLNVAMDIKTLNTGKRIVVRAQMVKNTEASLLKHRQKAITISDAIGSEAMSRSGSGDAGEALERVTGASVVGGKFIYVRGLGGRYSNATIDGISIPNANPDNQAVQMDLFPTALLDNVTVSKTFTPDKPGDFSGGSVDLQTKDLPDKMTLSFSSSIGFNSNTTGNEIVTAPRGKYDWLAFDNGFRALPDELEDPENLKNSHPFNIENMEQAVEADKYHKAFKSNYNLSKRKAPINQGYSFSFGNSYLVNDRPLGIMASLTYSRGFSHYEDGIVSRYGFVGVGSGLDTHYKLPDIKSREQVLWGGLVNLNYPFHPNHKISTQFIYNRKGEQSGRFIQGDITGGSSGGRYQVRAINYHEQSVSNLQIEGDHLFKPLRLDWKFSVGNSGRNEPDVRLFENNFQIREIIDSVSGEVIRVDTISYKLKNPGNYYYPTHYYREIDEKSREIQVDLTYAFMKRFGKDVKLKVGSSIQKKERENMEQRFEVNYSTSGGGPFDGDPADVENRLGVNWADTSTTVRPITEDIVYSHAEWFIIGNDTIDCTPQETPQTIDPCIVIDSVVIDTIRWDTSYNVPFDFWLVQQDERRGDNTYRGEKNVNAIYGMLEFPLTSWLLLVGGARYEMTEMIIFDGDENKLDGGIDEDDILPSLSFAAALMNNMNLRLAYGRTLARPTFKEKSPSATYEFTLGEILNGNPELKQTRIDNYDFRWEYFNGPGEILAMSVFYKKFKDPIEKSLIGNNNDVKYLNVGSATVYGIEFELRQSLEKLWSRLRNFQFEGNLTLAESEVDIDPEEMAGRQSYKIATTRPLQGQSPYILNLGLTYENYRSRTAATVLYNVFGERLSNVSRGNVPDVFEQPRPMLDFTFTQGFWKHLTAKLTVKNILNEISRETIEYEGDEFIYRQYSTGRSISVGLSYSL